MGEKSDIIWAPEQSKNLGTQWTSLLIKYTQDCFVCY